MPKASRFARALTPNEFDLALARRPLPTQAATNAARAVLVDGWSYTQAAEQFGLTRQRVHQLCKALHRDDTPPGWVRATVCLPESLMREIQKRERLERDQLARDQRTRLPSG